MRRWQVLGSLLALVSVLVIPSGTALAVPTVELTVPAGDVDALYAAVYDGSASREGVDIFLEGGTYVLDPLKGPHDGRLLLGDGVELSGGLVLEVDTNGVPTGAVAHAGPVIDTSAVFTLTPVSPAIVTLGDRGVVSGLTMTRTTQTAVAIDITERGTVEGVIVEGHFEGPRLLPLHDGSNVHGTITGSILRDSGFPGVGVIQGGTNARITLTLTNNLITNNGAGVLIHGGSGGADGGRTFVRASGNMFVDNYVGYNIWGAADDAIPNSGSSNNTTILNSHSDTITGSFIGVAAAGAIRLCSPIAGGCVFDPTSLNNNNTVTVRLQNTSFADNFLFDVVVNGVYSDDLGNDGDPVGSGNEAKVTLIQPTPGADDLSTGAFDCTPAVDPCLNSAEILIAGG